MSESSSDQPIAFAGADTETPTPQAILDFNEIYNQVRQEDKKKYPGYSNGDPYTDLRVLKETFLIDAVKDMKMSNDDIRALAEHLLAKEKTKEAFKDWIGHRGYYLSRSAIPKAYLRLMAVGQTRIGKPNHRH